MSRRLIVSPNYSVPLTSFTHAISVSGDVRMIYTTGVTARDAAGDIVAEGDFEGQLRQVILNIENILAAAGGSLEDLVQLTTYVTSREHVRMAYEIRRELFPNAHPASTTVQVCGLSDRRLLVEVTGIAAIGA